MGQAGVFLVMHPNSAQTTLCWNVDTDIRCMLHRFGPGLWLRCCFSSCHSPGSQVNHQPGEQQGREQWRGFGIMRRALKQ